MESSNLTLKEFYNMGQAAIKEAGFVFDLSSMSMNVSANYSEFGGLALSISFSVMKHNSNDDIRIHAYEKTIDKTIESFKKQLQTAGANIIIG